MELIPSFQLDHSNLKPGIYVSRVDFLKNERVTTFDIRMKMPNIEPALHPESMHTIEHIVATYLRNDEEWKEKIIYWGPMGCMTGCYLVMKGTPAPEQICPLIIKAFEFLADFEGEIPGAKEKECGNYLYHNLPMAKYEARLYAEKLKNEPCFVYPTV